MCKLLQLINLSEIKLYRCLSAKDGKTYDQCLLIGIDLLDLANRFRKRTCSNANSVANFYIQIFTTAADNQTSVDIHVLQGEREMAKDNKTLGMFRLDGIAPAMRGTPQIEVTFDIDANGIVHVSAKDLGTGKEQHITITSSTSMSKEDIEKAVKDAEQFAEADKKQREEVDIRNGADQMIFQTEKTLKELDGKIDAADKGELETKLNALKEAVKGSNLDDIKAKQEDLQKKFYDVSAKLYQNVNPQAGQPGADAGAQPNNDDQNKDGFVDADFKEV